jgi:hypothetical protein
LPGTIAEVFTTHPRLLETAVSRKFLLGHPDEFDQLLVFLTFPYDMQGAFSYEINVNNDVSGIGLTQGNQSADYGSHSGKLKSFVLMGGLDQGINGQGRFPSDPYLQFMRTYNTVQVITHEVAHRWLAFPLLREGNAQSVSLLHGSDLSHWSFFFNADASLMEGNEIVDRGSAFGKLRFKTSSVTDKLSNLDLYLMGFRDLRDFPPMFYVKNPTGTRYTSDTLPNGKENSFGGTRFDFSIEDIISANGIRNPSTLQSQKVQRLAFILVSDPDYPATPAMISKLQAIRDAFVSYFHEATEGQAWAVTHLQSSPGTTPASIQFPVFVGDSSQYTGYAIANWGATPADISFHAFDNSGAEMSSPPGLVTPRVVTLPPFGQTAWVGDQLFQTDFAASPRDGWIRADSTSSQVAGFFVEGDYSGTSLDGASSGNHASEWLCFTRVHGSNSELQNRLTLINPNEGTASLALRLMSDDGKPQGPALNLSLPGRGRISKDLSTLFPIATADFSGYAVAISDLGLIGYESFKGKNTSFSLPAQSAAQATRLFSAQFASGSQGSPSGAYFTDISILNTSEKSRHITIRLIGNNGYPVPGIGPADFWLDSGKRRMARGEELFGLADAAIATEMAQGTLILDADGPGVIGDITFGDPIAGRFRAALPLETTPSSEMILSQVAKGSAGGEISYFTGIAMFNPNDQPVTVTVEVYSSLGTQTGISPPLYLKSGARLSWTLSELVPGLGEQIGGYLRLRSTGGPIVSFGVYGESDTLRFLAAIPPQPIID